MNTELELAAMLEFDCLQPAAGRPREDKARIRRRERVLRTARRYAAVMKENPGLGREDALRLTVGGLKILIGFFFPWIGLAIALTYWLWDYEHSSGEFGNLQNAGQ